MPRKPRTSPTSAPAPSSSRRTRVSCAGRRRKRSPISNPSFKPRKAPMYHSTDPRAALAAAPAGAKPAATHFAGAEYAKFYEQMPAEDQNGARTWYARGQNFIIAYSDADKGAVLSRASQPDEYVVLLADPGAGAEIVWGSERMIVSGHSISFVPAGASSVTLHGAAKLVRMMTTRSEDLAKLCSNDASYAKPHPNLPPFDPWPEAVGGRKIRTYSL